MTSAYAELKIRRGKSEHIASASLRSKDGILAILWYLEGFKCIPLQCAGCHIQRSPCV